MRVVLQRVKKASVTVENTVVGEIEHGLMLLVGVTHEDTEDDLIYLADKVCNLRIFKDENGKMNHSLLETNGQVLSVSQFTLYGDCHKGRRPNFMNAAKPDVAKERYEQFNEAIQAKGIDVQTGIFGAMMDVELINDGPVTLILDSK